MPKSHAPTLPPHQDRLYLIATKLLQTHTLEETYKVICDEAMALVDAKYASIFTYENDAIIRVYASTPELYQVIPRKNGLTHKTFVKNKPFLRLGNVLAQQHPAYKKIHVGSDITIPLSYQNQVTAVLSVMSAPKILFNDQALNNLRYISPLASLAIQNSITYERLDKAIDDRNLFISVAAHEIRSPLTAALSFAQLMELKLKKGKHVSVTDFSKLIKSLDQLRILVKEFLEIDRIKKGLLSYTMKRWNLFRIVHMSVDHFKNRQPKRTIYLKNEAKGPTYVSADRSKMIEVFSNLLNNAHRYSSLDKPITVTMNKTPGHVLVSVTDQGIGIPQDQIPRIFEKFYTTTSSKKGMGLGLFLTKSIIDRHNGAIHVNSKVNAGTTISVEIPSI